VREFDPCGLAPVTGQQCADHVTDADQPMRRAGHDARQQPWPPRDQYVPPGLVGHLPFEVRRPVADAATVAKGLPPGVIADALPRGRQLVQAAEVAVDPRTHLGTAAAPDKNLCRHRAMVGQLVLAPLGTGMPQA
jgi:hypothetical protein